MTVHDKGVMEKDCVISRVSTRLQQRYGASKRERSDELFILSQETPTVH